MRSRLHAQKETLGVWARAKALAAARPFSLSAATGKRQRNANGDTIQGDTQRRRDR